MKRYLRISWGALLAGLIGTFSTISHAQIVITEVMYDATVDDVWEWIEIMNAGESAIDLDGYLGFNLSDPDIPAGPQPTISSALDPDTTINPGETMIIYDGFYANGNPNNFDDQKFRDAWGLAPTVKVLGAQFWPTMANTSGFQRSIGFWPNVDAWRADQTDGDTTSFANAAFALDFNSFDALDNIDGRSSITWTGNGNYQDGANWVQSISGVNGAVTSVSTLIGTGSDSGNPGILSTFGPGPNAPGLYFTEIMYDPSTDSSAPIGEYVELYNNTGTDIDLTGWVLDDFNGTPSATGGVGNIAGGVIPNGGTGILFNDAQSAAEFEAVWGPGLNLIPVSNWTMQTMSLNNNPGATFQDAVGLWDSFEDYDGDHNVHANVVARQEWNENSGFPNASNASLTLASLDEASFPRDQGGSWVASANGDGFGSFLNSLRHPGGDVGSPGTFNVVDGTPGDFDGDGDVDGRDFLVWQRGDSPSPLSATDLADWQNNYGVGGLAALGSVPEPPSLAMLAMALVPMAYGRRR